MRPVTLADQGWHQRLAEHGQVIQVVDGHREPVNDLEAAAAYLAKPPIQVTYEKVAEPYDGARVHLREYALVDGGGADGPCRIPAPIEPLVIDGPVGDWAGERIG